ncbi:hypothetical protein [Mucilaginibacter sp.]
MFAMLGLAVFQSCSRRVPYSIQYDSYTKISVKPFSVSYYSDYRFYKPTAHDLTLARQLLRHSDFNFHISKSDIVYVARTKISPFYEQFLLRINNTPIGEAQEKLVKVADSTSAVYYYHVNAKNEKYLFVHHQVEVENKMPVDSMTSKKEFSFIINSIQKRY